MPSPVRLPAFTPGECAEFSGRIRAEASSWVARHSVLPVYTLGGAAYLDVPTSGLASYRIRSRRSNLLLQRHFSDLYQRLLSVLSAHLGAEVVLSRRQALPGFHLFLYHPALAQLAPSLHFDLQYQLIEWPEAEVAEVEDRLSFTVLVEAGTAGAGLELWDLTQAEAAGEGEHRLLARIQGQAPAVLEYRLGEIFVHEGRHLHRIDATRVLAEGERRITLQGHALRQGGRWELYW